MKADGAQDRRVEAGVVRSVGICTKRLGMELHGTIANNLTSAVQSARRLSGHPVHADTLGHWKDLLNHARQELANGSAEPLQAVILELENELAARAASLPQAGARLAERR
jgi:hypothetical protein